jgi:hypothetical protein
MRFAMAIAWTTVSAKVLVAAKRRRRMIVVSLIGTAILQALIAFYRDQLMAAILPQYGKLGRWILSYPFAGLAAVIVFVGVWLVYIALEAAIDQVESPLVGPRREKLYRPRIDSKFVAGFVITIVLSIGIFVYGVYQHYRDPFPNVVALSHSWFAEGFRQNDLYIAIILKNYSDVPIPAHITSTLYVENEAMPGEDESPEFVTIPPWHEHTIRLEIGFKKDVPPPDLRWALEHNRITVGLDATYNNSKRDVTYHYLGRLLGDHYVRQLEGQINTLKDEID